MEDREIDEDMGDLKAEVEVIEQDEEEVKP